MDTGAEDRTLPEPVRRLLEDAERLVGDGIDRSRAYLASPAGRRARRTAARAMMLAAPLVFRVPLLRKNWPIRLLELAGGAAILVRLAEALRDWEPASP